MKKEKVGCSQHENQTVFQMGRAWFQVILIHLRETKPLLAPFPIAVTFIVDELKHQISAAKWYY